MVCIHSVAATGVVDIVLGRTRLGAVVRKVVESAKAQCRAVCIAFARMVVHDVKNNFDAGIVDGLHHIHEFGACVDSCVA